MDKKKIFIIGGVVLAVAGIGYYFWNKSKKASEGGAEGGAEGTTTPTDATAKTEEKAPETSAKAPLNTRKEKKKACGRKPLNKKKREEWQKCVDAGGTASFEGSDFDQWENDYMDFSGLDLDI